MDWNNIEYFKQSDFDDPLYPGSGENIDPLLVYEMAIKLLSNRQKEGSYLQQ